jgi:hypothetical protein
MNQSVTATAPPAARTESRGFENAASARRSGSLAIATLIAET